MALANQVTITSWLDVLVDELAVNDAAELFGAHHGVGGVVQGGHTSGVFQPSSAASSLWRWK